MSRQSKEELIEELGLAVRAAQAAVDEMDEAASRALGINRTDARCVDIVMREAPVTAGRLAKESGLTTAAVTSVLDRLEAAGYVTRKRDTADRRRVLVEPTELIEQRARELWGPMGEFRDELSNYTMEQLEVLRDFHLRARELNQRTAAKVREDFLGERGQ
jgi:DNA-binding MarR family transcriptional regulator